MDKELGKLLGMLLLDGLVFSALTAGLLAWLYRMNRPSKPAKMVRNPGKTERWINAQVKQTQQVKHFYSNAPKGGE
jgi:hypothetical protein